MKLLTPIRDREAYIAAQNETNDRRRRTALIFCAGKEGYESRGIAEKVSRRRSRQGKSGQTYKCRGCGKYHIGEPAA